MRVFMWAKTPFMFAGDPSGHRGAVKKEPLTLPHCRQTSVIYLTKLLSSTLDPPTGTCGAVGEALRRQPNRIAATVAAASLQKVMIPEKLVRHPCPRCKLLPVSPGRTMGYLVEPRSTKTQSQTFYGCLLMQLLQNDFSRY